MQISNDRDSLDHAYLASEGWEGLKKGSGGYPKIN